MDKEIVYMKWKIRVLIAITIMNGVAIIMLSTILLSQY